MPELTREEKLRLLTILLESRHGDLREQNLNRQGKGHFHVSGMGHEALAAISIQMQEDDYIVPFYRNRALVLGRGVSSRQLAIDYFAKAKGESHGRQMPSHYSCAEKHIWSVPTPTGSQLLPACGIAWGIKLDGKNAVVVATVGDAATRQGDFYEAICFAKEKKLPLLFVVEDNGYGISSPTRKINPRALDVVQPNDWRELDGANVGEMYQQTAKALAHIRAGKGPVFFWAMMERLSSHTSSDDQKLYRSAEELKRCAECDPLKKWKEQLIAEGLISESDYANLDNEIKERIRREFSDAETFDRIPGSGFQFAAGGVDHSWCRVWPWFLRQAPRFRITVHRLHRARLEPTGDQHLLSALAFIWPVEMSDGDLCALRRVSA